MQQERRTPIRREANLLIPCGCGRVPVRVQRAESEFGAPALCMDTAKCRTKIKIRKPLPYITIPPSTVKTCPVM